MEIGKKIKVLRLLEGCGQLELAKSLGMKAATHLNRWEQGTAIPRTNMLQRIGDLLGVNWPWLQDSKSDFVKGNYVRYRPLSPYVPYTPRWRALLQHDLAELLPELFEELKLDRIWGFQAPCKGGFIVATNPEFAFLISCLPDLYDQIITALPSVQFVTISDAYFAKQVFLDELTQEIFGLCGVGHIVIEKKPVPPPKTNVSFRVTATVSAEKDHQELRNTIQKHIEALITAAALTEVDMKITVSASRSSIELALDLVADPKLKKLALQMNDPMQ